jgi:Flp pilus assembly protein TadB
MSVLLEDCADQGPSFGDSMYSPRMRRSTALLSVTIPLSTMALVSLLLPSPLVWAGLGAALIGAYLWPVAVLARQKERRISSAGDEPPQRG